MEQMLHLLINYGYLAIFVAVLVDFLGAPITTIPLLVVAGALAANGRMSLAPIVLAAGLAATFADGFWYGIGRLKGQRAITVFCRLSRNRQQCVVHSTRFAAKYSLLSLLLSKFVPGLATFAPPAAGAAGMRLSKFLIMDSAGSLVWASSFSFGGYVLSARVHLLLAHLGKSASLILWVNALTVAVWLTFFYSKRLSGRKHAAPESAPWQ